MYNKIKMYCLSDCFNFKATVREYGSSFYVVVVGIGYDNENHLEYSVQRMRKFDSKKSCMDFFNKSVDSGYEFVESDFLFVSDRMIPINYFDCGVDFDER